MRDGLVVGEFFQGEAVVGADETGSVGQQVAQEHVLLAVDGEFGPVVADWFVEVQHAVLDQSGDDQVGRSLAGRVRAGERIAGDAGAGPKVDDPLAVPVGDDLGS